MTGVIMVSQQDIAVSLGGCNGPSGLGPSISHPVKIMLKSTRDEIRAICCGDPSINAAQVKTALAELSGGACEKFRANPRPVHTAVSKWPRCWA